MAFYLGLDAGGTKTEGALADEERILARAVGGSIKPLRVTAEQAEENLGELLEEIHRQSGMAPQQIAACCVGTAGLRLPQTGAWMRRILSKHTAAEILVCGDETIALDAVFPGAAGVLVMAGTGSNILGRTTAGETFNVGGWGPALGDEGSGYWIGHQALRSAFRAHDFGQPTVILDRVAAFWQAASLGELVHLANQTPLPDFSLLARIVVECAEAGDAVALQTLKLGGRELGDCAVHAYRKLRSLEPHAPLPGIAYTGGILAGVAWVRQSMMDTIHRALPAVAVQQDPVDPILGALWRARNGI